MPNDLYGRVAGQLADWLDETPKKIVDRWIGGGPAPFAAPVTDADKRAYFRTRAFTPDGQPNVQGRQQLLDQYGIAGYAQILRTLSREQEREALDDTSERAGKGDMLPDVLVPTVGGY